MNADGGILLVTINAKWIHPSLALRLLKANLGPLEERCVIMEFALRQPLREKLEPVLAARPRILGLSVSIWNHAATLELLGELRRAWEWEARPGGERPLVVLGGPEVSYLPPEAEIFRYTDYCVRGEGELAFRQLCGDIYVNKQKLLTNTIFINNDFNQADVSAIKTAYHLYTNEDLQRKLTYVEASRGCPFGCEFCLSANVSGVQEFPLEPFLAEMDDLIRRGARTFKFLDRTFNLDIERARRIMDFFLEKIAEKVTDTVAADTASKKVTVTAPPLVVHFEMVPSRFPPELVETLARFPPGTLRLEIGIQTLNGEVSARIGRTARPEKELALLSLLRHKTSAIIHADLIAGLPGEDLASFGRGFDLLWAALSAPADKDASATEVAVEQQPRAEIQLGILKLLPGAPIARHTASFGMRYNPLPPYELMESAALPACDLDRIKNFARFWELIVNRGLASPGGHSVFESFMQMADSLLARFGRNWGIPKDALLATVTDIFNFGT